MKGFYNDYVKLHLRHLFPKTVSYNRFVELMAAANEDGRFDHPFCQQAMQFFTDPQQVLVEMHRVMKTNGTPALNILRSITHNQAYQILA